MELNHDFMTPAELGQMLRKSKSCLAVERSMRRDHPPFIQIGRKILYSRARVLRWLEAHTKDTKAHTSALITQQLIPTTQTEVKPDTVPPRAEIIEGKTAPRPIAAPKNKTLGGRKHVKH